LQLVDGGAFKDRICGKELTGCRSAGNRVFDFDNASVFKTKTMKISIFRLADVDGDDAGLDTKIISYNLISKTFCDSPLLHTCCQRWDPHSRRAKRGRRILTISMSAFNR
jgi:hypothetical protein